MRLWRRPTVDPIHQPLVVTFSITRNNDRIASCCRQLVNNVVMTRCNTALLVPPPRSAEVGTEVLTLCEPIEIVTMATGMESDPARARLHRALEHQGCQVGGVGGTRITLAVRPAAKGGCTDESYRLRVTADQIEIVAASRAGWFYGAVMLAQWLRLCHDPARPSPATVTVVDIDDRPDFPHRGVLLDISRDKVPTVATAFALVERLADWKVNQLQLYMEHTFAYPQHESIWRTASPWTPAEVRALDDHCHAHCVTLVPNQNSFGHFHRWLVHDAYRPLAECPEGVDHPFSARREPFSLCATDPRSLDLLGQLYDELLPSFRSKQLNVGLDETLDLGLGRSAAACEAHGRASVYLDFVRAVHGLAAARGCTIQMWGDIVLQHPDRIAELPDDIVALAWGYEAEHPFAEEVRHFQASGRRFYVCPGTSSWLSFGGRLSNALRNAAAAARHGRDAGAEGYLMTDWGDQGHWQPLSVSYPGLLAGAALSWNADAWGLGQRDSQEPLDSVPMATLLDFHAFDATLGPPGASPSDGPGALLVDVGELSRATGTPSRNGSALFHLLMAPADDLEHGRYAGLSRDGLVEIEQRANEAKKRASRGPTDAHWPHELAWVADLLALAARLGLTRIEAGRTTPIDQLSAATRRRLLVALEAVLAEHERVWLARSRPGGREDSLARMAPLRSRLR